MSKLQTPLTENPPLLPMPLAFVCAGVLAAIAAQLFVSTDDFRRIYMEMGVELPWIVQLLLDNPILLPGWFLVGALAVLSGPRIVLPWRPSVVRELRHLAMTGAVMLAAFAAFMAYSHALVFYEMHKALQQ